MAADKSTKNNWSVPVMWGDLKNRFRRCGAQEVQCEGGSHISRAEGDPEGFG